MHDYKKEATSHILGASANLIGVCFVIITGLKVIGLSKATFLDDSAAISSILFLISGLCAYLSMRHNQSKVVLFRDLADYAFIAGISLLVITIMLLSFNFIL
jgi:hypothetical protein